MKVGVWLMILLSCALGNIVPHAEANGERIAYSGSVYPHFQVVIDNQVFCTAYENYGDLFRSRNVLYRIGLNDMVPEQVYSVRNAYSKVFTRNNIIFFTYPDSWISNHLTYGNHTWYSLCINDIPKKKNWVKLCENNSKTEDKILYFETVNGVYRYVHTGEEYGNCVLQYCEDGQYTTLLSIDGSKLAYGHSFVTIQTRDSEESQELRVFDIRGNRTLTVPYTERWLPEIVIAGDKLYYTVKHKVLCYDITTDTFDQIYTSDTDEFMSLCCDEEHLYIIEDDADGQLAVHIVIAQNGVSINTVTIPSQFSSHGDYMVIDGVLICGNASTNEMVAYNFETKNGYYIRLE